MTVMIGVNPHKGSHTAVAVDESERSVGELRVRSGPSQVDRLLAWAASLAERTWAVENARIGLSAGPLHRPVDRVARSRHLLNEPPERRTRRDQFRNPFPLPSRQSLHKASSIRRTRSRRMFLSPLRPAPLWSDPAAQPYKNGASHADPSHERPR